MSEFSVRPDWMAFCLPDISEAEVQADADVIRSGWWAKGPRTMEFQKKFAESPLILYMLGIISKRP